MANLILPKRYAPGFGPGEMPRDGNLVEIDRSNPLGALLLDAFVPAWMGPRTERIQTNPDTLDTFTPLVEKSVRMALEREGNNAGGQTVDTARAFTDRYRGARGFDSRPGTSNRYWRLRYRLGEDNPYPVFPNPSSVSAVAIFYVADNPDDGADPRIFTRDRGGSTANHDLSVGLVADTGGGADAYRFRGRIRTGSGTQTMIPTVYAQQNAWNIEQVSAHDGRSRCMGIRQDGIVAEANTSGADYNPDLTRSDMDLCIGSSGIRTGGNGFAGIMLGGFYFARHLSEAELRELFRDPWQMFKPKAAPTYSFGEEPTPGPKPADPEDLAHAHELGAPDTDRNTSRTPAGLVHAHALTTPNATTEKLVDAVDVLHAHAIDAPAADRTAQRTPAPLSHAHELGTPNATTGTLTDAEDVSHAHAVSTPSRQVTRDADGEDVAHAHALSTPAATTEVLIDPADVFQAQTLSTPTAFAATGARPDNVVHLHPLDAPDATKRTSRQPAPLVHGHNLAVAVAFIPFEGKRFPDLADQMQRQVVKTLGEPMSTPFGEFDGIFENDWFDPNLGPLGFEGAQTYVEFLGEQVRLQRGDEVFRQRDGRTYRVKEIREGEFDFVRYMLELVT